MFQCIGASKSMVPVCASPAPCFLLRSPRSHVGNPGSRMLIRNICAVLVGLAAIGHSHCVIAQGADEGSTLEEITVTPQRRDERLQDTPIASAAFSAAATK